MQAIYQIRNIKNNKIYIGSTNNIQKRWNNHKNKLKNGIHENSYLQSAWNKYGAESFEFSILEEVTNENRIEKELHYLNETKCYDRNIGYNFDKNPKDKSGANNPFYGKTHDQSVKEKLREVANNRSEELKKKMGEKNRGEGSAKSLLTWEKVRSIREERKVNKTTHKDLGIKYGVAPTTIQAILENKSWKE